MTRTPLVVGNWKMYKTCQEARALVIDILAAVADVKGVEIAVCPPFTALSDVAGLLEGTSVGLGAQNMGAHDEGAYTAEISARMLLEAGCRYVILGHSERRAHFKETDEEIAAKVNQALRAGLTPILCVGETLAQRRAGQTHDVVSAQVASDLAGVSAADLQKIVIAYEPVWAIGTGETATPGQAEEVHALIRQLLTARVGATVAERVRIQYGGSVKPDNISGLMKEPNIDGALVGGASLTAASFGLIVKGAICITSC